jgi:GlpG protein
MRKVTELSEEAPAKRLVNYLHLQNIEAETREMGAAFEVWVNDEDRLRRARGIAKEFLAAPEDPKFAAPAAPERRPIPEQNIIDVRTKVFHRERLRANATLTLILIAVCSGLHIVTAKDGASAIKSALFFSNYIGVGIPEIMSGQVWRLFTPVLLHGDFLHLLFNMIWLYQLGSQVERIKGPWILGMFVLAAGILCNSAQFLVSGPGFLGMSGVVYGLLGYIWMHVQHEPGSQFSLTKETVVFMLIWLGICLVGIIPSVANAQHVAGYGIGSAWGFLASGGFKNWRRQRRRRSAD